jgi:hypothetical protein
LSATCVRWALEEAGLPFGARLIDPSIQRSPDYLSMQPFGAGADRRQPDHLRIRPGRHSSARWKDR